ncbi:MAG: DUF655 domain-containing protein [Candidatus Aenigmarchaeota archaeon]|nr:DUF655 domain-containing protein [Candidatus Aenigmarchaeota archaeon]
MKEEYCVILDFLPNGYPDRRHAEPVAQAMGTSFFSLLELVPREGVNLAQEDDVYIGDGKRDKIRFIKGQLQYDELTNMAQSLVEEVVGKIVAKNEARYVEFFNKAKLITPRMHQMQLLPGVGKKHLSDFLDERRKKPFASLAEINQRVKFFPDPQKTIAARVLEELRKDEKYCLFVNKPKKRQF